MTVLATDNFNRANSPTLGANWTAQPGDVGELSIVTNAAADPIANYIGDYYSAISWPNNQYSRATFLLVTASQTAVRVRCSSTVGTYYSAGYDDDFGNLNRRIWKAVAGVDTSLATEALGLAIGDVVRIEVSGTTLKMFVNNVERLSVVDSAITAGSAGLGGRSLSANTSMLDGWEGGDLVSAGTVQEFMVAASALAAVPGMVGVVHV